MLTGRLITLFATALVAFAGVIVATPASAADCLAWKDVNLDDGTVTTVCAQRDTSGGGTQQTTTGTTGTTGTMPVCRSVSGAEVPCTGKAGTWNGSCYVRILDPQPPMDYYMWEGRTDGHIAWCSKNPDSAGEALIWVPSIPGVDPGPSPRELADRAVASMQLTAGAIGVTPLGDNGEMGIVNMPMWLWVADPGESTTGPITRTATDGAVTVTATAALDKVVYDMGEHRTLTCLGPGTAYDPGQHGDSASPDCGYTYTQSSAHQPHQAYTITATSYWTVTWSGGGQSGTIALDFNRSISYPVGEIQVLLR
jgi:hypothetical protein